MYRTNEPAERVSREGREGGRVAERTSFAASRRDEVESRRPRRPATRKERRSGVRVVRSAVADVDGGIRCPSGRDASPVGDSALVELGGEQGEGFHVPEGGVEDMTANVVVDRRAAGRGRGRGCGGG